MVPKPMAPAPAPVAASIARPERSVTAATNADEAAAGGYVDAHRINDDDDDANRPLAAAAAPAALAGLPRHSNEPIAETPIRTQSREPITGSAEPLGSSVEPLASDAVNSSNRRRRYSRRQSQKANEKVEDSSAKAQNRRSK